MSETYKHSYKIGENFLTSLSVCNVGHQKCEPGYRWGAGVRDHYCMHYIVNGKGIYRLRNKTFELSAGDTFMLYPGIEVEYEADQEQPWEYAWVGFRGKDAESILHATDFSEDYPIILKNIRGRMIEDQLDKIYEVKGNTYHGAVAMAGALYTLLALFMDYSTEAEPRKEIQYTYVEKAVDYIEMNYSYPLTVEGIADYVGISRSHLFRAFRTYLQQSPKEYLMEYRIKKACHLLKVTSLSVASVAYSVGFENNLYFSKAFRHRMHSSPTEYRNQVV